MSCIITYKGKKYSEEQFKEYFNNNKQEFVSSIAKNKNVIDSFKRKMKGVDINLYSQYLESLNKPNTNPILQGNQIINESEITYTDEEGKPCAKMGGRGSNFTKGSKWEIVKDLKGYPSHAQGGVDIKLGKDGFSFTRDNGVIEAKHGLVLPKIK